MSRHLSVDQTVELLTRLKERVLSFIEREAQLGEESRLRSEREVSRSESAAEEEQVGVSETLSRVRANYRSSCDGLKTRHGRSAERIRKAHQASRRRTIERIEQEEGREKYAVQKGLLDTEKKRKADLAANDQAREGYLAALDAIRGQFQDLEKDARKAFRGYPAWVQLIERSEAIREDETADEHQLLEGLKVRHAETSSCLKRFRRLLLPGLFRVFPVWLLSVLLILAHAAVPVLDLFEISTGIPIVVVMVSLVVLLGLTVFGYLAGQRQSLPLATEIAEALVRAGDTCDLCAAKAEERHRANDQRIGVEADDRTSELNEKWARALEEAEGRREAWPELVEQKAARAAATNDRLHRQRLEELERREVEELARIETDSGARLGELEGLHRTHVSQLDEEVSGKWQAMETEWKETVCPVFEAIEAAVAVADEDFPGWDSAGWGSWTPPDQFSNAARFGALEVDLEEFCGGWPGNACFRLDRPTTFSLPLVLTYPGQGSVLLETKEAGSEVVGGVLNNIILRLLSKSPPGRASFTIIDPVRLGQNFAGIMHLADYEENLINNRIWTQATEIEQRLGELNEHMEKVIQMYLRNEYETIADYNEQAGNIAEKYHYLVVADFPVNFSETALRLLINIVASGARCGVYTLIHWDRRQPLPQDFVPDELTRSAVRLLELGSGFGLGALAGEGIRVTLENPPSPDLTTEFLRKVGLSGKDANRVEVPFEHVAPARDRIWSEDTTGELRVPIGRTGATKLQYLAIGKGTRQHALFAGKTGSGKSTLFHVIITNLALWCSPEQVEFYLIDFKKGVEFKCYATRRLPHARVIAIESDREFGLSVLQKVDDELRLRGDLFRELGVQDLGGYKRLGGEKPMPRLLLMIDEFQEIFVEEDKISQGAAVLLDRIVRQGRAFGIHVLLGSQTLGGAYTLARTTIGQMVIRVALQCNEADAYLIMDDNNPAPRLLTRPGEGIYNDMAGAVEGNSPFQAVWLSDSERDRHLEIVRAKADEAGGRYGGPFVFEGNAPAEITENLLLRDVLEVESVTRPSLPRVWLGGPNSIKGPTEVTFRRQSGNHLLLVGQSEESMLAIVSIAFLSLAAQHSREDVRLIFFDSTAPGTPQHEFLRRVTTGLPHEATLARSGDVAGVLGELTEEMKKRGDDDQAGRAPAIFLFVHGLQNFKKLRQEDEFGFSMDEGDSEAKPSVLLNDLIVSGAGLGIHLIVTCDSYNNLNRFLARKTLSEFELRVLFQMSANDSAALIDSPEASALGLHRALYYNEHEGYLETFRPYRLPGEEWVHRVIGGLQGRD